MEKKLKIAFKLKISLRNESLKYQKDIPILDNVQQNTKATK